MFSDYKDDIEKKLNEWMTKNEYKEVKLEGAVLEDLMDELFCLLTSNDLFYIMDEIDKDMMLGECDWCQEKD